MLIAVGFNFVEDMSEYGYYERELQTPNGYCAVDLRTRDIFYIDDDSDIQKIQDLIDLEYVEEVKWRGINY